MVAPMPGMFGCTNSIVLAGLNSLLTLMGSLVKIGLVLQSLSPAMVVCWLWGHMAMIQLEVVFIPGRFGCTYSTVMSRINLVSTLLERSLVISLVIRSLSPVTTVCLQLVHGTMIQAAVPMPDMFGCTNSTVLARLN